MICEKNAFWSIFIGLSAEFFWNSLRFRVIFVPLKFCENKAYIFRFQRKFFIHQLMGVSDLEKTLTCRNANLSVYGSVWFALYLFAFSTKLSVVLLTLNWLDIVCMCRWRIVSVQSSTDSWPNWGSPPKHNHQSALVVVVWWWCSNNRRRTRKQMDWLAPIIGNKLFLLPNTQSCRLEIWCIEAAVEVWE